MLPFTVRVSRSVSVEDGVFLTGSLEICQSNGQNREVDLVITTFQHPIWCPSCPVDGGRLLQSFTKK